MIRRWLRRFGLWLVEKTEPSITWPPIADWERPYHENFKRELNRILW